MATILVEVSVQSSEGAWKDPLNVSENVRVISSDVVCVSPPALFNLTQKVAHTSSKMVPGPWISSDATAFVGETVGV